MGVLDLRIDPPDARPLERILQVVAGEIPERVTFDDDMLCRIDDAQRHCDHGHDLDSPHSTLPEKPSAATTP